MLLQWDYFRPISVELNLVLLKTLVEITHLSFSHRTYSKYATVNTALGINLKSGSAI